VWSDAWALAPAIRAGRVKFYGIDPKGGMELGQAPEVCPGGEAAGGVLPGAADVDTGVW
jgi:hypothetical protein